MESENKENEQNQEELKQPAVPTIVIRLTKNGIQVEGPIENKILCFGMLEMARQAVTNWRPDNGVIPVPIAPARGRFDLVS